MRCISVRREFSYHSRPVEFDDRIAGEEAVSDGREQTVGELFVLDELKVGIQRHGKIWRLDKTVIEAEIKRPAERLINAT